jgi:hypothetical protein
MAADHALIARRLQEGNWNLALPEKPRDEMATPSRTASTQVKGLFQPDFMSP